MAGFLRDTPIKRKLMLVILLTTGFALLLTASALTTYETVTFRHSLAVDMGVLARIIGVQQHRRARLSGSKDCPANSRCSCRRAARYQSRHL